MRITTVGRSSVVLQKRRSYVASRMNLPLVRFQLVSPAVDKTPDRQWYEIRALGMKKDAWR